MKVIKLAKITSEDCVDWLIRNEFPNSQTSDWKRRSKKKNGEYIVRSFENVKTGEITDVYEINGNIVDTNVPVHTTKEAQQPIQKKIYYAIGRSKIDFYDAKETKPVILLFVTDAGIFDREHHQTDFTPNGTIQELKRLGYRAEELMEAVLEIHYPSKSIRKNYDLTNINEWANEVLNEREVDIEEFKEKLISSSLFQFSLAFQEFMANINNENEEYEIIPI